MKLVAVSACHSLRNDHDVTPIHKRFRRLNLCCLHRSLTQIQDIERPQGWEVMQTGLPACRCLERTLHVLESIENTLKDADPSVVKTLGAMTTDLGWELQLKQPDKRVETKPDWYFVSETVRVPARNLLTALPCPLNVCPRTPGWKISAVFCPLA